MEQTKDLTSLSVTELIGTLKAHEKHMENQSENMLEGAFNVQQRRNFFGYKPEYGKR